MKLRNEDQRFLIVLGSVFGMITVTAIVLMIAVALIFGPAPVCPL